MVEQFGTLPNFRTSIGPGSCDREPQYPDGPIYKDRPEYMFALDSGLPFHVIFSGPSYVHMEKALKWDRTGDRKFSVLYYGRFNPPNI